MPLLVEKNDLTQCGGDVLAATAGGTDRAGGHMYAAFVQPALNAVLRRTRRACSTRAAGYDWLLLCDCKAHDVEALDVCERAHTRSRGTRRARASSSERAHASLASVGFRRKTQAKNMATKTEKLSFWEELVMFRWVLL